MYSLVLVFLVFIHLEIIYGLNGFVFDGQLRPIITNYVLDRQKNIQIIYYEINQFLLQNNIIGSSFVFYYLNYNDPQNQFIAINDPTTFNSNDRNGEIIFIVYQKVDPVSCYQLLSGLRPMKSVTINNGYYFGEIFVSERNAVTPNGVGIIKYPSGAEYGTFQKCCRIRRSS